MLRFKRFLAIFQRFLFKKRRQKQSMNTGKSNEKHFQGKPQQ